MLPSPRTCPCNRGAWVRACTRTLNQGGYIGMSWPEEFGGRGLSPVYDAILAEEVGRYGAPGLPSFGFLGWLFGLFGTPQQIQRFLPGVQAGDIIFCQGFSEPGAGSDLPSLRTRARFEGDHYVVNGHKLWTTGAHYADWCLMLVRTDPNSRRHHGLTCLLVDMRSAGVTARPVIMATGIAETSEVFLDEVEVPIDQRIGGENDGWNVAMSALTAERGPESFKHIAMFPKRLRELETLASRRGLLGDVSIRERLARAYVNGEAHRLFCLEQMSLIEEKAYQGSESSVAKLLWAEMEQDLHHLAMDILGSTAILGRQPEWMEHYLHSRLATVYGGTIQIQRNSLAQRALGMPRLPRPGGNEPAAQRKIRRVRGAAVVTGGSEFQRLYTEKFAPTWALDRTDEGVLLVTYNQTAAWTAPASRPPASGRDTAASLATSEAVWSQIAHDDENRIVILTGHEGVFSDAWESRRPKGFYNATMWGKALYSVPRSLNAFLDVPTLTIGAANGAATVHGEYLLLCDVLIAAESASFGDKPHFMNGHVPGDGVNVVWPLLLGWSRGRDFLLSGKTISAHEALDLGIVKEVVPDDQLIPRCYEVAADLLRADPLTLRFTAMALRQQLKTLINQFMPHSMALEGMAFIEQSQGPE